MRAYESLIRFSTRCMSMQYLAEVVQGHKKSRGLAAPALLFSLDTEVAEIVDFC